MPPVVTVRRFLQEAQVLAAVPRGPSGKTPGENRDHDNQTTDEPIKPRPTHHPRPSIVHHGRLPPWTSAPAAAAYRPGSAPNFVLQFAQQNTEVCPTCVVVYLDLLSTVMPQTGSFAISRASFGADFFRRENCRRVLLLKDAPTTEPLARTEFMPPPINRRRFLPRR